MMTYTRFCAAFAAFATTALLFAAPAYAQATRTWVSGVGDDANPCSRTAPCKTFAGAISKTAPSGEIICLDPGGFGALTITKALTIDCEPAGQVGGVLVAGTNGIVIQAGPTDNIQLIGLDIDGLGPGTTSINGIRVISAASVSIIHCTIYDFNNNDGTNGAGVLVAPTSGGGPTVYIRNTEIRNNAFGVSLFPANGASATAIIDHSSLFSNFQGGVTNTANLAVQSAGGKAILTDSSLTASVPITNAGGGQVISYGNNTIRGGGGITETDPLQ